MSRAAVQPAPNPEAPRPGQRGWQVIVVGAGPAGSATAYHLARAGVETLLIDKASFPRDKVCGDCLSPRAQQGLSRMGALEQVAAEAHQARVIRFRSPGGAEAETEIRGDGSLPNRTLVLPRRRLDQLLLEQALRAGARFRLGHVRQLLPDGGVLLNGDADRARVVVIATGAALGLLKRTPLATTGTVPGSLLSSGRRSLPSPVHSVAARCYLSGLTDPGPDLRFFFDHLPLPGYAWLFPTGPCRANLGYWYNGRAGVSAAQTLPRLLTQHPVLRELTGGSVEHCKVAGYPIRTDFLRAPLLATGMLAVGEAAGLVNPFTGEGIDYALESGELAAQSILTALGRSAGQGPLSARDLSAYPRALRARFRSLFLLMQAAQRYAFNPWVFDRLFGRGAEGQAFVDALIQVCFGAAAPSRVLAPLELLRLLTARP